MVSPSRTRRHGHSHHPQDRGSPISTTTALHRARGPLHANIGNVMLVSGLLHLLGVLIHHQVRIGRPLKHDVDP